MKLLLLLALGLTGVSVLAQGEKPSKAGAVIVPPPVEQKFSLEFPRAAASWQTEGANFKAKFINPLNNLGYIIVYDLSGAVVRREKELEPGEVPGNIAEFLKKNSRSQGLMVWTVTDSAGATNYYSPLPEGTVIFDKAGIPLSKVDLLRDSLQPPVAR